jgi:hypothetical protein
MSNPRTLENSLKTLRIVWFALLSALLLYAYLCSIAQVRVKPNPALFRSVAILAFCEAAGLLLVRKWLLSRATVVLQTEPENRRALGKWSSGNIFSWAVSLCIGLYGLILRYMGFEFRQVLPFLAAGFCLILFLPPRRPPVMS